MTVGATMRASEGAIVQVQGGQDLTVVEEEMRCRKGALFRPCRPRICSLGNRGARPEQASEEKKGNPKCGLYGKELWDHAKSPVDTPIFAIKPKRRGRFHWTKVLIDPPERE